MRFLLDANMPRAAAGAVATRGHDCIHVRDTSLASASDAEIAAFAREHGLVITTRDWGFADIRIYPPADYAGIIVLCLPDTATASLIADVFGAVLDNVEVMRSLPGSLVIAEAGRIRLRRG